MAPTKTVRIGQTAFGGGKRLALIAGPCVIESESHVRSMAEKLVRLTGDIGIPYVFKASYDKANRSSIDGFRGPGLKDGLRILREIRRDCAVPVISDIHERDEIEPAAEVLDALQIPAFLSRQTGFLEAAGRAGKPVNIKKGQFMAPWDMKNAANKVAASGNDDILLTERGVSFGYNNLVADMRSLPIMRQSGYPVIFDATHSVQLPGGKGTSSGGDREMATVLARAAVASGVDGLFLEVHDDPDNAKCDGPNMIRLDDLRELLEMLVAIDGIVRKDELAAAENR
ncbi:MAG: 3-deoxy-8-phosphooctulonate synthase [Planctomycetes bacterium]|nr:3-deoxy-8-phosphooctulonate synthase [Planctomycetota bacterium]MCC8116225.1 3-deoxy-8-phosphooctulonate synthase [Planctomycetota bacterium]MCD7895790.1 3-deoxy-8-phosphooctulonate synthase [Planctomycetaceae bacterium]